MTLPLFSPSSTLHGFTHQEPARLVEEEVSVQFILSKFATELMSDVDHGVVLIDCSGVLLDINTRACDILNICRVRSVGVQYQMVFQNMPEEMTGFIMDVLHGDTVSDFPITWSNPYRSFELLVDSNRIESEYGKVYGAYLLLKDVTSIRQLESEIRRNDRLALIGQVAAAAAHEIRNPLTSIKGFLQLMQHSLKDRDLMKERRYTEIMLSEIERINQLVGEFLLLSKPKTASYQTVSLTEVVGEIIPIIESESRLHDIIVQCNLEVIDVAVLADAEQLKQVILNICKNAIEAMDEQGKRLTIRMKVNHHENAVFLEVQDQGPGIPPFMIDKIFEPFFTTKEHGTGLGLPICKRIIQDIGGQIRISSKSFGTVVTIVIPIYEQ